MRTLRDRLEPDGIAAIQFIGDDGPWSASLVRTVEAVFGRSLMLAAVRDAGRVGPRWLFVTRRRSADFGPDCLAPPAGVSWRVIRTSEPGDLLTDDHFPAELSWARTAAAWRDQVAAGLGSVRGAGRAVTGWTRPRSKIGGARDQRCVGPSTHPTNWQPTTDNRQLLTAVARR